MKKIVLFSFLLLAAGASTIAQQKIPKKATACQKKPVVSVKTPETEQAKTMVPKNLKHLSLQKTKLQPAVASPELRDERSN